MTTTAKAIWLIRPAPGHTGPSVVLRAACLACARSAGAAQAGDEGTAYYRDPERSTVVRVTETGISGVVLRREA